jgi:SecD/SecF fusion protein
MHIKFLEKRKLFYVISGALIVLSIGSLAVRGLNYGIDFKGGRTYVVRFDQDVLVADVQNALSAVYGEAPEVKTYGANNQVRITTEYKIEDNSEDIDNQVEALLMKGLQDANLIPKNVTLEQFTDTYQLSSQKVGPTISDDIRKESAIAIVFSLIIIFIYILIRFRNWQYGLGAVAALAHDSLIVLGLFSLLYGAFVVLLAIFLFGGETIRGFTFALLIGVVVGTYSSIFIATPIAYDTQKRALRVVAQRKK